MSDTKTEPKEKTTICMPVGSGPGAPMVCRSTERQTGGGACFAGSSLLAILFVLFLIHNLLRPAK